MQYQDIPKFSEAQTLSDLKSDDPEKIIYAVLSVVLYSSNYKLSIETIRPFFTNTNENIRGCSIECISHIARLWNEVPQDFIDMANKAVDDESAWVRSKASDTLDDLEVFIKDFKRF